MKILKEQTLSSKHNYSHTVRNSVL